VWTADASAQGEIAGASAAEGVARVDPRVPVAANDLVRLAVDVSRLLLFDAETGHAIEATERAEIAPRDLPEHQRRAQTEGN
jgi:hypothetical protein